MAYVSDATVPASEQHLTHSHSTRNQEAPASPMIWPLLDPPEDQHLHDLSSLCSSKKQGQGTGSLSLSHTLCLSSSSPFPPVWDYWGSWEMRGREGKAAVRKEDPEEDVTIPSNTFLQRPLRKWYLLSSSSLPPSLPPHFSTNPSHLRSTRLVRENGAGRGKRFQSLCHALIKLSHPDPKTSVSHCCVVPLSLSTSSTTLTLTKKNSL